MSQTQKQTQEEKKESGYTEYKVPRLLWENFESIMLAQSRRYISELARRLDVSERELQRRVLPSSDSLKIIMMDSQAESLQCRAYLQQDSITTYCRKPVVYQSEFCAFHCTKRMNVFMDSQPIMVEKVKSMPDRAPMWIHGNTIIHSNGETVGKLNRQTRTVKWFKMEE